MRNLLKIATFFIAIYAISTVATAQKTVYRCGASYSQIPCEGAVSVDASDARSKADKLEADKATQRDMKQAREMEKTRLKEEKKAITEAKAAAKANAKSKTATEPEADTKKKSASKKKEPEFFTAKSAPDSKKKD